MERARLDKHIVVQPAAEDQTAASKHHFLYTTENTS